MFSSVKHTLVNKGKVLYFTLPFCPSGRYDYRGNYIIINAFNISCWMHLWSCKPVLIVFLHASWNWIRLKSMHFRLSGMLSFKCFLRRIIHITLHWMCPFLRSLPHLTTSSMLRIHTHALSSSRPETLYQKFWLSKSTAPRHSGQTRDNHTSSRCMFVSPPSTCF